MDSSLEATIPVDLCLAVLENTKEIGELMLKEEQADCPVYHHHYPGIYIREVHIAAGVFSIGHIQKTRHLNIMLKGRVNFINPDGTSSVLTAPMIFMSDPGRKMGLILEDMVWFNLYPTNETDVEVLEETYLDKSVFCGPRHVVVDRTEDIKDFEDMIKEYGLSDEIIREESERTHDLIPFPEGPLPVGVFDSPIEGKGLFATGNTKKDSIIVPGRLQGNRTPAGRYINHSKNPTAKPIDFAGDVYFVALRDIQGCTGGCLGEEITIDYREAIKLKR